MFQNLKRNFAVAALVVFAGGAQAAEDDVIAGLGWESDAATVESVLNDVCESLDVVTASPVQFPLASDTEQHFRCEDMALPGGDIEAAVFVVADDRLQMAELSGGVSNVLVDPEAEPQSRYLGYDVYNQASLFVDRIADKAWLLSAEALHPNLFTWSNPFLDGDGANIPEYDTSAALPSLFEPGGDLETLLPQFEAACPIMNVEPIKKPWLATEPDTQTQVNCFGYVYAGFPRKFEAVFGDGELELIWILTGKQEEARVREALIDAFGAPEITNDKWDVFMGGALALRKDKPEVLVISEKLIPFFQDHYVSQ